MFVVGRVCLICERRFAIEAACDALGPCSPDRVRTDLKRAHVSRVSAATPLAGQKGVSFFDQGEKPFGGPLKNDTPLYEMAIAP